MAPFFGDDGGQVLNELFFGAVALDQGDAAGGRFLFAPGVVGEDGFEADGGEVDPAGIGWELEAEDVFLFGSGIHPAKIGIPWIYVGLPEN